MCAGVVLEGNPGVVERHKELDVCPVPDSASAIVLGPAFVERHLAFIISGRQCRGLKGINAVAVDILQPRAQARRIPIT
jgi:hypothetical protein